MKLETSSSRMGTTTAFPVARAVGLGKPTSFQVSDSRINVWRAAMSYYTTFENESQGQACFRGRYCSVPSKMMALPYIILCRAWCSLNVSGTSLSSRLISANLNQQAQLFFRGRHWQSRRLPKSVSVKVRCCSNKAWLTNPSRFLNSWHSCPPMELPTMSKVSNLTQDRIILKFLLWRSNLEHIKFL